jgi:hypothetical protein
MAVAVNIKGLLLGLPFEQDAKEASHVFGDLSRVLPCEWSRTAPAPDFQRSGDSLVGQGLATTERTSRAGFVHWFSRGSHRYTEPRDAMREARRM